MQIFTNESKGDMNKKMIDMSMERIRGVIDRACR